MKRVFLYLILISSALVANGQAAIRFMDAATNGDTVPMVTVENLYSVTLKSEDAATGGYTDGPYDRHVILSGDCSSQEGYKMGILFETFDIDPGDTLIVYDGPGTNYSELIRSNNNMNPLLNVTLFPSALNASGKLTVRFKTNGDGITGQGFSISVMCRPQCETVTPHISNDYERMRDGVITGHGTIRIVEQIDTTWSSDSTTFWLDTNHFRGVHMCLGETLVLHGYGEYTNYYGYGLNDSWSEFRWNYGNGDTLVGPNETTARIRYRDLDCYDVTLSMVDGRGCASAVLETVRVRLAQNPIKTIYDLATICTTDSSIVNIGYGEGATITMRYISFEKKKSKTVDCKTFIPDGRAATPACLQADPEGGFRAPIFFDDFPSGRTVTSGGDICSVCINYEHSYMGDYRLTLICPTGRKAILKYGTACSSPQSTGSCDPLPYGHLRSTENPNGIHPKGCGGGGRYTGIPYGGSNDSGHDGKCSANGVSGHEYCDSICNMFGVGFDYCFSRNIDYTTVTGNRCNVDALHDTDGDYIASGQFGDQIQNYAFNPVPAPFAQAGYTAPSSTFTTQRPSNHEERTDYYLPADDFDGLIGCPLNGEWNVQIIDFWPVDNGWIFNWSLDICGVNQGLGCEYQVPIDSVVWVPDSNYGDFDLGHWRGLNIEKTNQTRSVVSSHDTAGTFPIIVKIYDNFGCVWDTSTNLTTVWSPTPELGPDRLVCDVVSVVLDARDRHTESTNQSFRWEPFGQTTDTIHTLTSLGDSRLYTVDVDNFEHDKHCTTRDSVRVNINKQPTPNFDPGVYPLEGCEPFTIHFDNTSLDADKYLWVFGDGDSSTAKNPVHTYGVGQYDFKYYVESQYGCKDSLVYSDLITVYSSPVARFSWEPMNPTVLHPEVTFQNLTIPQSDDNEYYWEIQYDRDNNISWHTLRDVNPSFEWYNDGTDISGSYVARLIAKTSNMGPSGYVVECRDTVENSILLVNDFLQFPSAVTPNGDGINDKFVIKNLIDGLGYPNNSLAIYDRWGKRVYYKENIQSEDDFWDPAADNIPTGTYFWRFVGKGYLGDIQRNGAVEVIK